jgi:hypothetical protein
MVAQAVPRLTKGGEKRDWSAIFIKPSTNPHRIFMPR